MIDLQQAALWADLAQRLVDLVVAQRAALNDGDVERFAELVAERTPVQEALFILTASATGAEERAAVSRVLEHVASVDRASFDTAQSLLRELSAELGQMRHGRFALRGYGRTGPRPAFARLDQIG